MQQQQQLSEPSVVEPVLQVEDIVDDDDQTKEGICVEIIGHFIYVGAYRSQKSQKQ